MKVVTAQEMRHIDQQTIEQIGIPGAVLMEHAGSTVVRAIHRHFAECRYIAIVVGRGTTEAMVWLLRDNLHTPVNQFRFFSFRLQRALPAMRYLTYKLHKI